MVRIALAFFLLTGCAMGDDGVHGRGGDEPPGDGGGWDLGDAGSSLDDAGADAFDAGMPVLPGYDAGMAPPPPPPPPPPPDCATGDTHTCMTGCGSLGAQSCVAGAWSACAPPAESCNGSDDDCDGVADDGFACSPGDDDTCTTSCGGIGTMTCNGTCGWGACQAPGETCNGADDDCDGVVDDGDLCPAEQECRAGACARVSWTFEAEAPGMGHGIGRAEADGWSASTPIDSSGTLVYGPYTLDIPAGLVEVRFRMMIDNNTANTDVVARIDVNDFDGGSGNCGTCVLASRDIRRTQFTAANTYQDFVLTLNNPGSHRLELRTTWTDRAYIRQDRVTVRAL